MQKRIAKENRIQFDSLDDVRTSCRAGHLSAERGHRDLLARTALACHAGMAIFAEAGDSGADGRRNLATYVRVTIEGAVQDPRENRTMRMAAIRVIIVAAALSAAMTPLRAEIRILANPGGQVGPFLDLFDRVRESGERVVIDGPCLSACTLVLMTVPEERICVTRRAVLGFHAARSIDRRGRTYAEPEASRAVLESYPGPVRDWISRRGGLTSRMLLLRGRELAAIYPRCR